MGPASPSGCRSNRSRMSSDSWRMRWGCRLRGSARDPGVPFPAGVVRLAAMEPHLTATERARADLLQREPLFHRPEFGTTRPDFERMMAPEFWEVGASGRRYSREFVL